MNRRTFAIEAGALAASLALRPWQALADVPSYGNEMPDMLLAYLARQLNELAAKWDRERAAITTPAQLESRNRFVREKFRQMIHGLPEKTPLEPVVVATHERAGYRVENVMFQSRPDFWVPANLYVPAGKGPFPGIISPCGHSPVGRLEPQYQCMYVDLAKAGFVVLAFDPIGQGERRQYWNPRTNRTEVSTASTYEHSMPGQVQLLLGEDLSNYRIWDGMRAIDYLLTRPEVDGSRIGCAGHSGGGTLTKFISALDERVVCAVINEGGSTNRWPVHVRPESRIGPSDVEQNLFPAALYGIDAHDLHVAIAPRPLLVLIENYSRGFLAAAEGIRARYRLLGVEDKFATEEATDPHAWTPKLRLATTSWFSRWFYNRPGPEIEPDVAVESAQTLNCLPNGSIRYSHKGETIFTLLHKQGEHLPPAADRPANPAEIGKLIDYRRIERPLEIRQLVTTRRRHYQIEKLEFLSEPGIYVPTWVFVPDRRQPGPAILYVDEAGKEAEGLEFGLLEDFADQGRLVVAVDVRGIGATRPPHQDGRPGEFGHLFDVETAMTYMAWSMDRSLFGMRVQDVVRSLDYTLSRTDVEKSGVQAIGRGAGALWVLFAAALDPRVQSLVAERGLVSYDSLTKVDRYRHGAAIFIRDVLKQFDLPQVAAAIADRRLALVSPVDPMKNPVELAAAEQAYEPARRAYRNAGTADRLRIAGELHGGGQAAQYLSLSEEPDAAHSGFLLPLLAAPTLFGLSPRQEREWRQRIKETLFVPNPLPELMPENHGSFRPVPGVVAERITYSTAYGLRVPVILYLPETRRGRIPALIIVNGHGGDKYSWYAYYAGMLYARAGAAVLTYDAIGEGERNIARQSGTRAHDRRLSPPELGRRMGGLMMTDLLQAVAYLRGRPEVDPNRIAALGHSMGSFVTSITCAVEKGLHACVLSGGGNLDGPNGYWDNSKPMCQGLPYRALSFLGDRPAAIYALHASRGPTFIINGLEDDVVAIPPHAEEFFRDLQNRAARLRGSRKDVFEFELEPGASHRPFLSTRPVALWLERNLDFPMWTEASIRALPVIRASEWAKANGAVFEANSASEKRIGGTPLLDLRIPALSRRQLSVFSPEEWERRKQTLIYESWVKAVRP